jgi:tRNA(Ile)-lysidine synthase
MVDKVLKYVKENKMIEKNECVIAGVSGGADSICLLFILMELRKHMDFSLVVVHVEHGVRGKDSEEDALFVEDLCKKEKLVFEKYSYNIPQLAKKEKMSEEEAGRNARYHSFELACKKHGGSKIAVAHNENDRAETVLLHMFRGTGLQGLAGMEAVRGPVIRPLLCISRKEIEEYLSQKDIPYRTDITNFQLDYTRNKIRLKILPYAAEEINDKVISHIAEAAAKVSQAEAYLQKVSREKLDEIVIENKPYRIEIDITLLLAEELLIQSYVLRLCLKECSGQLRDLTSVHVEQLLELCHKQVGRRLSLPHGLSAVREYRRLTIEKNGEDRKKQKNTEEVVIEKLGSVSYGEYKLVFTLRDVNKGKNLENKYTKCLDYDTIKFGLKLRTRQPGDSIVMNALGQRKKIKAFFIDNKIPSRERERIPLLVDGDNIVGIMGYRISEEYKVTSRTKNILEIQVSGGNKHERDN